jgi:hypothetical protein
MTSSLKFLAKTGNRGLVSDSKTLPLLHECHGICVDSTQCAQGDTYFPAINGLEREAGHSEPSGAEI